MTHKANMNSKILLKTATIFFLLNLHLKQGIGEVYFMVDFICMGFFELQGAEERITKLKILAHSGDRTQDPWIMKPLPLLLGHDTWYTIDKLKLNQI